MEGHVVGDVVLCIGQISILTGREMKSLNSRVPYFPQKIQPLFIYVDDFGISDDMVKKSDYYYRFPRRCSTFFEGYSCGEAIVEYVLNVMELSDMCQSMSIIFNADEGLGSGLTAFMLQYVATYMPGFVVYTAGILPHMSQGGLASINTCLGMEMCLEYASCCMLRRMDDTAHIISHKKSTTNNMQASVYEDVCRCLASDLLIAIREINWLISLCSCEDKLVDIRSSMWYDTLNLPPRSKVKSKGNNGVSSDKGNTHHNSLRRLSTNLHSVHIATPLPKFVKGAKNTCSPTSQVFAVKHASFMSMSQTASTSRTFCDVDLNCGDALATVSSVLNGATQTSVRWSDSFTVPFSDCHRQHALWPEPHIPFPTARHGDSSKTNPSCVGDMSSHMSAICFNSPYAKAILREAVSKATLTAEAGAYSYWLNFEHFLTLQGCRENANSCGSPSRTKPAELIDITLHNLKKYIN